MEEGSGFMKRYKPYRSQTMVRQVGHGIFAYSRRIFWMQDTR